MIDTSVNLETKKPLARCEECDTETHYYNIFISPTNERQVICVDCLMMDEKGFTTKYGFKRNLGGDSPTK
jgi:hypothetical protein